MGPLIIASCSLRSFFPVRWLALLLLSALLHWLVLNSVSLRLPPFPRAAENDAELASISLLLPPTLPAKPEPVAKLQPKAQLKPKPKPKPVLPAAPDPQSSVPDASSAPASGLRALAETEVAEPAKEAIGEPPVEPATDLIADAVAQALAESMAESLIADDLSSEADAMREGIPHYQFSPLPSATLEYNVEGLRKGNKVYGSGKIFWRQEGNRYSVTGEASVLFFTLLDFQSQGLIDEHGVSPVLYTQKRFRKSPTHTHFQREPALISFSASTALYPRQGGEQDRASLVWQLAAIGRADPAQFVPGQVISLPVAGVRDMQTWEIKILSQEEVETGAGKHLAWHIARLPPPGSREQRLDIWLAQELGWYPVKLRQTDYNGEYLDMILSDLVAATAAQAGRNDL